MSEDRAQISARIPQADKDRLRDLAERYGLTEASVLAIVVHHGLDYVTTWGATVPPKAPR